MGICRLPVCLKFSRRILFQNSSLSVLNSGRKFSKWPRDDETSEKPAGKADDENLFTGNVPLDQLQVSYCRSSGPGGQNVNKGKHAISSRRTSGHVSLMPGLQHANRASQSPV
ncbi:unnamed protein product, partial [Ixodes pacificus]